MKKKEHKERRKYGGMRGKYLAIVLAAAVALPAGQAGGITAFAAGEGMASPAAGGTVIEEDPAVVSSEGGFITLEDDEQAPGSDADVDEGTVSADAQITEAGDIPGSYTPGPVSLTGGSEADRGSSNDWAGSAAADAKSDAEDVGRAQEQERNSASETENEEGEGTDVVGAAPTWNTHVSSVAASLPAVRNQGNYGVCWAFSPLSVLELSMMKKGLADRTVDYSEVALAYSTLHTPQDPLGGLGSDRNYVDPAGGQNFMTIGGNPWWAFQMLANGYGPVAESRAPYGNAASVLANGLNTAAVFADEAHVNNIQQISLSTNADMVKEKVIQNGGVSISLYYRISYYNADRTNYYCDESHTANHAAVIVGWDDNYPGASFRTNPGRNGAWLVRNSWGTDSSGLGGYFWMSYGDAGLQDAAYAADAVPKNTYDNNYFHDGCFYSTKLSLGSTGLEAANVFTVHGGSNVQTLRAVSVGIAEANTSYTIEVYRNLKDSSNPESGSRVNVTAGSVSTAGIYTIPLSSDVTLNSGDVFSVVVHLTNAIRAKILMEKSITVRDSASRPTAACVASRNKGESFIKAEGRWKDLTSPDAGVSSTSGNIRIKALTTNENANYTGLPFNDVRPGNFWYDAVLWGYKSGVAGGVSSASFGSGQNCSRAQIVTLLYRLYGGGQHASGNAAAAFTDVQAGKWYTDAVAWAASQKIAVGTDSTHFSPDKACTRAEAITMIWRALHSPAVSQGTANPFLDVAAKDWYYNSVLWAVSADITSGTEADLFSPGKVCRRSEIITFLYRVHLYSSAS